jgi:hypothetical protein
MEMSRAGELPQKAISDIFPRWGRVAAHLHAALGVLSVHLPLHRMLVWYSVPSWLDPLWRNPWHFVHFPPALDRGFWASCTEHTAAWTSCLAPFCSCLSLYLDDPHT